MSLAKVQSQYHKLIKLELKGHDVSLQLQKLLKYIETNGLDKNKIYKLCMLQFNKKGKNYDFTKNKHVQRFMWNEACVEYLPKAPPQAVNPYFPQLKITIPEDDVKYIQVIRTTANIENWFKDKRVVLRNRNNESIFLDTLGKVFPFYSSGPVFLDTPQWGICNFISRSTKYWRARCYGVRLIDSKYQFVVGVEWGFFVA